MNKEFFQRTWGEQGYYEYFSYGVGIKKVMEVSLFPFLDSEKIVVEIGSGGGVFTQKIVGKVQHLIAVDVIRKPHLFKSFNDFTYIELPDNTYRCAGVGNNVVDFCFCYNVFCHLNNYAIAEYLKSVNKVLKPKGDFVFMLANYAHTKRHLDRDYELGELTSIGHFVQDERTLDLIIDKDKWEIVSPNMIPEHRDIIVHLKKK